MSVPRIFLSYRRADSASTTGRLRDRLVREFGEESVLTDVSAVPPAVDYRRALRRLISECDVMLVVIGPMWLNAKDDEGPRLLQSGDTLRAEVEIGLKSEIAIVPVLVGGAKMPSAAELPDSIAELAYRNAVPIRRDPDFHRDVDRLLATEPFATSRAADRPRRSVLLWLAVSSAAAAAAVAVVLALVLRDGGGPEDEANPSASVVTSQPVVSLSLPVPPTATDAPDSQQSSPTELAVEIVEGSVAVTSDRTRPANLGLQPDGERDLSVTVRVSGEPTGLIVTICPNVLDHTADQWDTYTGDPPDKEPPFDGRDPHEEPTYQLAVVGAGRTINRNVDLDGPLPDGSYELFMPLFPTPTVSDGLCVTAVRETTGTLEYATDFIATAYPPVRE